MSRYAVLVCGGRTFAVPPRQEDYPDYSAYLKAVAERRQQRRLGMETLDALSASCGPLRIIEGGANGADALAREWALANSIPVTTFPAHWKELGKKAGPVRNSQMLSEGQPQLVVAFPGGKGTADMVRKAKAANVEILQASQPSTPQTT